MREETLDVHDILAAGIRKPARYMGPEYFPLGFKEPKPGDLKVALVFPDLYEIGMSNTGMRILYSLLARKEGVYVDMAFSPWPDMQELLKEKGAPLRSRQGQIPLGEFDVLGFSLQYELTYTNVLTILDLAGIPLRAADRTDDVPLIVGGGPCATHPEPVAPFFDCFIPGDGEEALPRFLDKVTDVRAGGKTEVLKALAGEAGVYVPSVHPGPDAAIEKQTVADLDAYLPFHEFPVPATETIFDRLSVELARGCQQGCRFCEAGFTYRRPRERSPDSVVSWIEQSLDLTGFDEFSLASLSTADYSQLVPLADDVDRIAKERRVSLSISSLRAYGVEDEVLDVLAANRPSSLTLAPEAGSQRLRNLINKNVTDEQLLTAIGDIAARGFNRVKLYFMIGLPTETDEDVDAIASLSGRCYDILRERYRHKASLTASVSMFVPRPHTPFQWEGMATREELSRRISRLRGKFPRRGKNLQLKWHNHEMSLLEATLTRGDASLAAVIEEAWKNGARFDSWDEFFNLAVWDGGFQATGVDPLRFLGQFPQDERLPWEHMKIPVSNKFLWRERERGFAGKTTKPCTPFAEQFICYQCGADCPEPEQQPCRPSQPSGGPSTTLRMTDSRPSTIDHPAPPESRRIWLTYRKVGPAVLLGHLDLLRQLTLIFRRAGVVVARSRGFNPRPRFYFPAPLPLGFAGHGEVVEVHCEGEVDIARLAAALNEVSVPGIEFVSAIEPEPGGRKISKPAKVTFLLALRGTDPVGTLTALAASGDVPHLGAVSRIENPPHFDPPAPKGTELVEVQWAANGPRIDRILGEALPDTEIAWAARSELLFQEP